MQTLLVFEPAAQKQAYGWNDHSTHRPPSPCPGRLMHSRMPIQAYAFYIYSLVVLFAPSRRREVSVCTSVITRVPGQVLPCLYKYLQTHADVCVPVQTHVTSHVYICLYTCLSCRAINTHTSLLQQAKRFGFFFSSELPNIGSRRLAVVVTLIPRFLLQLASKQHCKFPNNWDEVLCKSPSGH